MILFDIVQKKIELSNLEKQTLEEQFWQKNTQETAKVLSQIKQLKSKIEKYEKSYKEIENLKDLTELVLI